MFHIVFPLANVLVPVGVDHDAVAVFFALAEIAIIVAPISISQLAFALEDILREHPFVGALRFSKVVHALALKDAIDEIAFIKTAISPFIATSPIFLALEVLPFELNLALLPGLTAVPMLVVIHPFAIIG